MRALLIPVGSHGDVHPFIAIGRALSRRGHEVTVMTNPYFDALVRDAGLKPRALGERQDLRQAIRETPDSMHRLRGATAILRDMMLPLVPDMLARVGAAIRELRPDVMVIHPLALGVPWLCEKHGVPWAVATLAPCAWMSRHEPVIAIKHPFRPEDPPLWWSRLFLAGGRRMLARACDRELNALRRTMGLPMERDQFAGAMRGGMVNLALWSRAFRAPVRDDPPRAVVCGFPWHDRHREGEAPAEELDRFLNDGEPPIVFTLGTAAVHLAGRFYHDAAEACRVLGRRGLLLVGRPENEPRDLPPGVRAFTYAPFSTLLPRAAATVHHGGIGTTAQALRAGRPTVAVPMAHDQFDNAARVFRLGVSRTVDFHRLSIARLSRALREVLDHPAFARRAAELGPVIASEDGGETAAAAVERLAAG